MTKQTLPSAAETQLNLRDQFHNLILPELRRQAPNPTQSKISANQLAALITRAHIAGATAPVALETSPKILADLKSFFNEGGTDRDLAQKILDDQRTFDRTNNINRPAYKPKAPGFGG